MKNLLGFILYLVAVMLYLPLTAINFVVVFYKNIKKKKALEILNKYCYDEAYSLDVFANRALRTTWNTLMRTKGGYNFGERNETISSALGKNERDGTLSFLGKALCWILNMLDKNHCEKSIDEHLNRKDSNQLQ